MGMRSIEQVKRIIDISEEIKQIAYYSRILLTFSCDGSSDTKLAAFIISLNFCIASFKFLDCERNLSDVTISSPLLVIRFFC